MELLKETTRDQMRSSMRKVIDSDPDRDDALKFLTALRGMVGEEEYTYVFLEVSAEGDLK